jgi:hypothetical protein
MDETLYMEEFEREYEKHFLDLQGEYLEHPAIEHKERMMCKHQLRTLRKAMEQSPEDSLCPEMRELAKHFAKELEQA